MDPIVDRPAAQTTRPRAALRALLDRLLGPHAGAAIALLGAPRTGKSVLVRQAAEAMVAAGAAPGAVLYVPLHIPGFAAAPLAEFAGQLDRIAAQAGRRPGALFVDDVDYLPDWLACLGGLAAAYPRVRIVAVGRVRPGPTVPAAALARTLDRIELPPVSFAEYLDIAGIAPPPGPPGPLEIAAGTGGKDRTVVGGLNKAFVDYLNAGGFPEMAARPPGAALAGPVAGGIVKDSLLGDLPARHGIKDPAAFGRLLADIAFDTGREVSLIGLAKASGAAKNTVRRHLDLMEDAGLIRRLYRVDDTGRPFRRAVAFKAYIANPSLRAALFGPVAADDPAMPRLVETAVLDHWRHWGRPDRTYYLRGESLRVGFVERDPAGGPPVSATDVSWPHDDEAGMARLGGLVEFLAETGARANAVLHRRRSGVERAGGIDLNFHPAAQLLYHASRGELAAPAR